jgi:hypothetical protein
MPLIIGFENASLRPEAATREGEGGRGGRVCEEGGRGTQLGCFLDVFRV